MTEPRRYFLLGPTASGKTGVSLALAGMLDAEILSLDSMLVYRGMDIGTAKPSREERAQVPHHLLDLVDPSEEFSVKQYLEAASAVERELAARGKAALYVGGTTMWFKALVFGLLEVPQASAELRAELQEVLQRDGVEVLREELASVDPEAHARIHPHDTRRLLRALETWRGTGRCLSDWQSQWGKDRPLPVPTAVLQWPREVLRQRVVERFRGMVEEGLVEEVEAIRQGVGFGRTAAMAIGYRQLLQFLEGGCSLEQAVTRSITRTHILIRRQMTWLRSFPDLVCCQMSEGQDPSSVARRLATAFGADEEGGA